MAGEGYSTDTGGPVRLLGLVLQLAIAVRPSGLRLQATDQVRTQLAKRLSQHRRGLHVVHAAQGSRRASVLSEGFSNRSGLRIRGAQAGRGLRADGRSRASCALS